MDIPPEVVKTGAGFGGALVAAVMKWKDGLRVVAVYLVVGLVAVWSVRSGTDWVGRKWEIPADVVGFFVGFVACSALQKIADTIADLSLAASINSFVERWLGAKTSKAPEPEERKP